jgi:hypothetical protein
MIAVDQNSITVENIKKMLELHLTQCETTKTAGLQ